MDQLRNLIILVVDDNVTNQLLLKHRLARLGAKVEVAANGKQACEMAEGCKYDMIFMDIQMPVMSGFEALYHLRKSGYEAPIIAWTCSLVASENSLVDAGFCAELAKPLDTEDFFEVIPSTQFTNCPILLFTYSIGNFQ